MVRQSPAWRSRSSSLADLGDVPGVDDALVVTDENLGCAGVMVAGDDSDNMAAPFIWEPHRVTGGEDRRFRFSSFGPARNSHLSKHRPYTVEGGLNAKPPPFTSGT